MVPMKSAGTLGWLVALAALGWAFLPKCGDSNLEMLQKHAYLVGHLLGWLPRPRETVYDARLPSRARKSNGTITEVQGFVDRETFSAKYQWKGPAVFRGGATAEHGFNLECLTGAGRPVKEQIAHLMGDRRIRVFRNQDDDASADMMTIREYEKLAREAEANSSAPLPYARSFPQGALRECQPVPTARMQQYHHWNAFTPLAEEEKSMLFYSTNRDTSTKMHMDVGDSFFTQVVGRKKWLFVDPEYASSLQIYGYSMNLVYIAGYDVHRELVPPEVPIKEVILNPGDMVYFPSMTFHAVYNLDDVTVGIDELSFDMMASFKRHWLLTLFTILNPSLILKAIKMLVTIGRIDGYALYFDHFSEKSQHKKHKADGPA